MSSFFTPRASVASTRKSSLFQASNSSISNRGSFSSKRKSTVSTTGSIKKTSGVQTCKDTGVGDCPACLGARTNCHESECQLCCEKKMCGPEFKRCPFAPAIEIQTEPICDYTNVACRCVEPCGVVPCILAEDCEFADIECRCIDKTCNTSKHCIILEDDVDECPFSSMPCRCQNKACSTVGNCVIYDTECESPFGAEWNNTADDAFVDSHCKYGQADLESPSAVCQTDKVGSTIYPPEPYQEYNRSQAGTIARDQSTMSANNPVLSQRSASRQFTVPRQSVSSRQASNMCQMDMPQQSMISRTSVATSTAQSKQLVQRQSYAQTATCSPMCTGVQTDSSWKRKYCTDAPPAKPPEPDYDNVSIESSRHSAFDEEGVIPDVDANDVDSINGDYTDQKEQVSEGYEHGNFEVSINEIPTPEGPQINKIKIRVPKKPNTNTCSQSKASNTKTPIVTNNSTNTYRTISKTISTSSINSVPQMNKSTQKPQTEIQREYSQTSHKSILATKPSVRSIGGESIKNKSQVHFDIDITSNENDRTIVFRRSDTNASTQTPPKR